MPRAAKKAKVEESVAAEAAKAALHHKAAEHDSISHHTRLHDVDPAHHTRSHDIHEKALPGEDTGEGEAAVKSTAGVQRGKAARGRRSGGRAGGVGRGGTQAGAGRKGKAAEKMGSLSEEEEVEAMHDTANQEQDEGEFAEAVKPGTKRTPGGKAARGPRGKGAKASGAKGEEQAGAGLGAGTGEAAQGAGEGTTEKDVDFKDLEKTGHALPETGELTSAAGLPEETGAGGAGGAYAGADMGEGAEGAGLGTTGEEDMPTQVLEDKAATAAVAAPAGLSSATGAVNLSQAAGIGGPVSRVLYVLKQAPEGETLGEFRGGVANRYSVPEESVSFRQAGSMDELPLSTPLSSLTTEFIAMITEKSGLTKEWVFWFDRGGQELGITPAAYSSMTDPSVVLAASAPSVLDDAGAGLLQEVLAAPAPVPAAVAAQDESYMAPGSGVGGGDTGPGGSVLEGLAPPPSSSAVDDSALPTGSTGIASSLEVQPGTLEQADMDMEGEDAGGAGEGEEEDDGL